MIDPPPTPHPWHALEHEGERYLARFVDGVCWLSRVRDRALWLFDPASEAPSWTHCSQVETGDLFGGLDDAEQD